MIFRQEQTNIQTVYFLHGLLGTCDADFSAQIKAWQENYRLIPIDLPGHGHSPKEAVQPYYRTAVELLRSYLSEHGPGHLVGLSYLGGSITLRGALLYPELCRSLVLTGYVPEVPREVMSTWIDARFLQIQQNRTWAEEFRRRHGDRWQQTFEVIAAEVRAEYATAIAVSLPQIATLKVPTLLVNGALKSDERVAAATLPSHNPCIESGVIPAAGHIATQDQPELFNLMVERFWKRVEEQKNGARED